MVDYLETRRKYVMGLNSLEKLALRNWAAWWDETEGTPFIKRRKLLEEPFAAIAQTFGEQAAAHAADYLFVQRGLDETLAGMAYPEVADPVGYEQAVAAFRASSRLSEADWKKLQDSRVPAGIPEFNAKTFKKLSGALNRLVLQPARKTIQSNIADGMMFARVPEPGACDFCLMLASRGAVYSADTAGMTEASRFHDHCRCIAMEVGPSAPLPRVNQELEAAWKKAMDRTPEGHDATHGDGYRLWKNYLDRRSLVLQSQVRFPPIPGVKIPKYRGKTEIKGRIDNTKGPDGVVKLPLPSLHQMPGHVLYGWTTSAPWGKKIRTGDGRANHHPPGVYKLDDSFGHRAVSKVAKSKFPDSWSNQKIANAVRDVLESDEEAHVTEYKMNLDPNSSGNKLVPVKDYSVSKKKEIDGVEIKVKYCVVDGVAVQPYAYPVKG
ncbi:EndoU domain-containing protein [Corynebacterium sp. TAE3-ERU2]|uniref:VG15 protein n=1 Tax=Corynebacterium sp. TAE3-ERU2 TaxID=2849497 RepID=UPI001C468AC8|nr:EndoU domain-containing protein [Corynebacterium sp. TAE3-ERU2]MBV7302926.1 EndoU domain-containing protein [Corynebacterium sp. TAE3-ERU2]